MAIDKERFNRVVQESREQRARVRQLVADHRWREAEPDRTRMAG